MHMPAEDITIPLSVDSLALPAARNLYAKLGELISKLEAGLPTTYSLTGLDLTLAKGERYAGLILHEDGTPSHHLVLLPGQAEDIDWPDAIEWAAKAGGELPTRREQALLFANLKGSFEARSYWSSEQHSDNHAWFQDFLNGTRATTTRALSSAPEPSADSPLDPLIL
jgi:hypothetical protein